jgi:DNA-binding transcriptional LysR family regulator
MGLNFRQTEILWALVTAGSSSGAARLLNVSQPAVSKMLSQIEAQLGHSLFVRVRGKLQPTEHVKALFSEIAKAQKAMRRVNDIAQSLASPGSETLTIAAIPGLAYALLPDVVARFQKEYPEAVIRLETAPPPDLIEAVLRGDADLALLVMLTEHPLLTVESLAEGRLMAAIPRDHALAARSEVSLEDLSRHPQILVGGGMPIGMLASAAFAQAGLPFRLCAHVPNTQQACALVNAGVGVTLADTFTSRNLHWPNVVMRPLKEEISIRASVAYSRDHAPTPLAHKLVSLLRQHAAGSGL